MYLLGNHVGEMMLIQGNTYTLNHPTSLIILTYWIEGSLGNNSVNASFFRSSIMRPTSAYRVNTASRLSTAGFGPAPPTAGRQPTTMTGFSMVRTIYLVAPTHIFVLLIVKRFIFKSRSVCNCALVDLLSEYK